MTMYGLLYFCKLVVVTPLTIRSTYNCNYSIWHRSNFGKCSVWSQLKIRVMEPSLLPSTIIVELELFRFHYDRRRQQRRVRTSHL